jgi:PAS domain S-box-containing protein
MKHPRTHRVTASSPQAHGRDKSKNNRTKTLCSPKPGRHPLESMAHCYRAILETSSSAILLLSPESIILEWNRTAERVSGWIADEALGRSYTELCLPVEMRESFMNSLARVTEGNDMKGLELPLMGHTGSETMLSWNITRVLGTHRDLIGLMAVGTVIASHIQVEQDLLLAHAKLRSEARQTQRAVEEERRRIARELHDEFGQALTGLKFDLAWFGRALTRTPAPTGVENLLNTVRAMSESVDALLVSVRATAEDLRPAMLDDLGLVPALECLATTFQDRTGARCMIDVAPELSSIALPLETSAALFRIAQEMLTNVMRHAAASLVHVRLYQDDARVALEVTDNGKGIAREKMATPHSFGLRGMQERAFLLGGHFHIVGTPGIGTRAIVSVPVAECFAP